MSAVKRKEVLQRIRAELDAATKGPWFWRAGLMAEGSERTYAGYPQRVLAQDDGLVLICETFDGHEDEPPPHATLIAHAPTYLAALLDVAEAADALWPESDCQYGPA